MKKTFYIIFIILSVSCVKKGGGNILGALNPPAFFLAQFNMSNFTPSTSPLVTDTTQNQILFILSIDTTVGKNYIPPNPAGGYALPPNYSTYDSVQSPFTYQVFTNGDTLFRVSGFTNNNYMTPLNFTNRATSIDTIKNGSTYTITGRTKPSSGVYADSFVYKASNKFGGITLNIVVTNRYKVSQTVVVNLAPTGPFQVTSVLRSNFTSDPLSISSPVQSMALYSINVDTTVGGTGVKNIQSPFFLKVGATNGDAFYQVSGYNLTTGVATIKQPFSTTTAVVMNTGINTPNMSDSIVYQATKQLGNISSYIWVINNQGYTQVVPIILYVNQ